MPEPARGGQRYLPGLDGLRALAVLAVIAYHLQLGFAQGGLLGVGVFFTLSGYLITDLLLGQREAAGRLPLADFWLRRARRLLPALFVLLAVVTVWVALLDRAQLPATRGAAAASAAYVSNWWLIAQHSSYFARFGPPSPLGHLWSLAVEEQFYLLWPWLLWLGLRVAGRLRGSALPRYWLAGATLLLAGASAAAMAVLYQPGYDPTRVYDGTDTRAFALLVGAALAFVWPSRGPCLHASARRRRLLDGAGIAGLAGIMLLIWRTGQYSPFVYPGGMGILSAATAAVVAAVTVPGGAVGRALGWRPLRWLGVRSYGIYLWHYPIIVLTTPADGKDSPARAVAQAAATIVVAALSWRFVEEPVRHGALGRLAGRMRGAGWRAMARRDWAVLGSSAAVVAVSAVCLSGAVPAAAGSTAAMPSAAGPGGASEAVSSTGPSAGEIGGVQAGAAGAGPRTSCRAVVHIGDSTSDGLVLPSYQPDPSLRIAAQYRKVGVTTFIPEVSGARSIVETWHNYPNGYTVAEQLLHRGYHGCWVIALGTNDAADVAVGSYVGMAERIRRMMTLIGNQPVMWVNVRSLLATGPYAESGMRQWNRDLLQACPQYPNMRVYDWAAAARPGWFIPDGIHYTPAGYAARSQLIAQALAEAFPAPSAQAFRMHRSWFTDLPGTQGCLVS